jgi:ABC-2 type transport system permease protein
VARTAIWLFMFGDLFHKIIDIPGFGYHGSYLAYLVPGVVAMNAMSGNMWRACCSAPVRRSSGSTRSSCSR